VTQQIETIQTIASGYDVIVFDQWGVLHNGTTPYPGAVTAVAGLSGKIAVLSNSGKRAAPNAERITGMGFPADSFDFVMTSGEALWQDVRQHRINARALYPVERCHGDAADWADGLDLTLVSDAQEAGGILMMGLPDDTQVSDWTSRLKTWRARDLPMYCSNPDRHSPRDGRTVVSPGALAHSYAALGGRTNFYGKPHRPVFLALENMFGPGRYLMVGDSMEHDIAGAQLAGWDSLLIEGGLYADRFAGRDGDAVLAEIAAEEHCDLPTYRLKDLR
jgi:HAD superfamily hydrolase (TIGR01459 family)